MSHLAHSQLNDSQVQKITYPNLTEVRYEENTEKVFVGIPTQNSFIQSGIPLPTGFLVTPLYNKESNDSNVPIEAQGAIIPIQIQCKFCRRSGTTLMEHRSGPQTWIVAFFIFIFFLPLVFLPFVLKRCKDKVHYCPNCGQCVGKKTFKLCNSD